MKYIAAYMLAKLGGKENPNVDDIKIIIESAGIEFKQSNAEEIVEKLKGKDLNEVIVDGKSKLSVVSNPQKTQNDQQQSTNEQNTKENEHKEEEETLDLGGGFDDLFS